MQTVLRILNEEISLECAPGDQRRLEDLAAALEARLAGFSGDEGGYRQLLLAAIALLGESQAAGAALMRARHEIERLNDMMTEARADNSAPLSGRRLVNALRA
jgi:hypothetical protein